nr:receptor type tyrosine protein phosphatase [Hymenolepis microstoma]
MLIQTKYAELLGDTDGRRICRATRLTGCTTRLKMSTTRCNKHVELSFVVIVEGRRDSYVRRFKWLIGNKFPDIFFTRA